MDEKVSTTYAKGTREDHSLWWSSCVFNKKKDLIVELPPAFAAL
jgi:hypothetical protein